MTEGNLPFLNDEGFHEPEVTEAQAEATEQPQEPKGEPEAAPPAVSEDTGKHIPISALLDEREKRQALAREAEELRQKLAQFQAQQQQPQPDFYENPEARLQQERTQVQQMLWNERLNMSETLARQSHGDEAVNAAREAFAEEVKRNPALYADLQKQANPYGYVVQWHKRQSVLSKLGDDPDAYIEAQVQARLAAMQASQPKPTAPPPSLASAAASGGPKAPPASGFASLFGE